MPAISKLDAEGNMTRPISGHWATLEHDQRVSDNHRLIKELSIRYDQQQRRWSNYSKLLGFFAFTLLFLSVLWLQRDAQTGFAVYSTVEENVVGIFEHDTVTSAAEILPWLRRIADEQWKDPACGDGKCQAPFEFPSYSRFGCRADCSHLEAVESDSTALQVDLYYNFQHATGRNVVSLPPTSLMELVSWNVCPKVAPHGKDCLFEEDQKFTTLRGSVSHALGQVPPGMYELVIKRDYFNKVRGAVRNVEQLESFARRFVKVDVALDAAAAGWHFEAEELLAAKSLAQTSMADSLVQQVAKEYASRREALEARRADPAEFASADEYNAAARRLNDTTAALMGNVRDRRHHVACRSDLESFNQPAGALTAEDTFWDAALSAGTADLIGVNWKESAVADASELDCTGVADMNACECGRLAAYAAALELANYQAIVDTIVSRLDPARTTVMKANFTARLESLLADRPEQVPFLSTLSPGTDHQDRLQLQLDSHVDFYFHGPGTVGASGQANVADEELSFAVVREQVQEISSYESSTVAQRLGSKNDLLVNINARLDELEAIKATVYTLPEVEGLLQWKREHSITDTSYNLLAWHGGQDAYQQHEPATIAHERDTESIEGDFHDRGLLCRTCNIDARLPSHAGTCTSGVSFQIDDKVSANPYTCFGSNAPDAGELCTRQVDLQLDCDAMCVCSEYSSDGLGVAQSCSASEGPLGLEVRFCRCEACDALAPAEQEEGFQTIRDIARQAVASGSTSSRKLRSTSGLSGHARGLTQVAQPALQELKSSVDTLAVSQAALSTSVQGLTNSVDQANKDAEKRASDPTLTTLIESGQAQLRADQKKTEELLQDIIGKQQQALQLAAASQASLDAITKLTSGALETLQNIEKKFETTIDAIKLAASSRLISAGEALDLWKRARRQRLANARNSQLINLPCSYEAVPRLNDASPSDNTALRTLHDFVVPGNLSSALTQRDAVRERWVGTGNRIVGGILIHTTRREEQDCEQSRFENIANSCIGDPITLSFGADPTFKAGTGSFNPDLSARDMLRIYNCTTDFSKDASYDVEHSTLPDRIINEEPFCEQYFNSRNMPWGFHSANVAGHPAGYPIWLDVNLSHHELLRWLQYLDDGLFFDSATETVSIELITYNANLQLFSKSTLLLLSENGGAYHVHSSVDTIKVELYQGARGATQLALEILLGFLVALVVLRQLSLMVQAHIHEHSFLAYYTGAFDILDLLSTLLMVATLTMWWIFAFKATRRFGMSSRFDVYRDLRAEAFITQLSDGGVELMRAAEQMERLDELAMLLSWYFALNGVNILVMIARVLHLMHFHPRLGVVTRSLVVALPDLLNFLLVGGVVFVGYAMMAHLIFGATVERFASLSDSIITCLEIIMGDMSVNDDLRALPGLMSSVGQLGFWSYELIVFLVLLNFLLAIIVDSFCEVKSATIVSTSVLADVRDLLRVRWADLRARFATHAAPNDGLGPRSRVSAGDMGSWLKQLAFGNATIETLHDPSLLVGTDSRVLQLGEARLTKNDLKQVLQQQHDVSRGTAIHAAGAQQAHPVLRALFGAGAPVDLGDATQLELMAYWIFERFSVEDGAAPAASEARIGDDIVTAEDHPFATEVRCRC